VSRGRDLTVTTERRECGHGPVPASVFSTGSWVRYELWYCIRISMVPLLFPAAVEPLLNVDEVE
jgi:hypothetical protein